MSAKALAPLVARDKEADENGDSGVTLQLGLLRGIVFGRHGRVFREPYIQAYLDKQPWYKRNPKFTNAVLSPLERENLDTIRGAESESHHRVEPGDLRFWVQRRVKITPATYYNITDLRIIEAEIEANHGKTFRAQPALQRYFEERYWYKPDPRYSPKSLNAVERANLAAFRAAEKKSSSDTFSPFDVIHFEGKRIPDKTLQKLSIYELRLTRNALYALHGYRFKTPWLQEEFSGVEWYEPTQAPKPVRLTPTEEANLAAILAVEKRRHDDLSTKPIAKETITGLFIEDLRKLLNEIPARHGKPFTDVGLKSYFGSLPWYKPDPKYTDARLSAIERKNMAILGEAMKMTTRQFNFAEG